MRISSTPKQTTQRDETIPAYHQFQSFNLFYPEWNPEYEIYRKHMKRVGDMA